MKISASIYSDKKRSLQEVIKDLVEHQVDLLHVDCNDDVNVFKDIERIREWCNIPIDLHIITEKPSTYFDLLRKTPVEYVTFQYESLKDQLTIPEGISGKIGLAVTTHTEIDVFDAYKHFDFILIMATVPGQSGGVFDTYNFQKIRQFRKRYPNKSIHVDGGVNGEVSFILRNMGVSSSVSGSYLFNAPSIGHALMNLTKREIESGFSIADFMTPLEECPVVIEGELSLLKILETIETGQVGFSMVVNTTGKLTGIVSSADIRKGLLKKGGSSLLLEVEDTINRNPKVIEEEKTVLELLQYVKKTSFPLMYLPVVDKGFRAVGMVQFVHLIKAEI
jgi:pentose-5-phosphate-3-epimerase